MSDMTDKVKLTRSDDIGLIEIDNPPVNASSRTVRRGLLDAVLTLRDDASVRAVVIHCAGRTFMAGGDIQEFDLPQIESPHPHEVFAAIESLDRPVVAALHGSVLGGGLELALACHHRVALSSVTLGMPEVKLGLIPGGGGTQRLPRVAGICAALDMMTKGEAIEAWRALELGIVDAVVDDDLLGHAVSAARCLGAQGAGLRVSSRLIPDTSSLEHRFFDAYRRKLPPEALGGRAAREIVARVEAGLDLPCEQALALERLSFEACRASAESKALRHIFFAEREAARVPGLATKFPTYRIAKVGVVGAGTMGSGIATSFVSAGITVTLLDVSAEVLARGVGAVRKNLDAAVSKGRISVEQAQQRISLLRDTLDDADLSDCDLVIEAAFEDLTIKKSLCERLGAVCKQGAIIASNTSTLNIDVLAEASGRPAHFLGMHFFSPAHVMKLLEVVRGAATSAEVLATVMALAKRIGKAPVVSGVCYGFIGNRMLEGYLRETEFLLLEGAAPAQIDRAIQSTGMAMGPCRMIDMAGIDVAAKVVLERRKAGTLGGDAAYRIVVQRLHELGRHGQKTSAGYYRYEGRLAVEDPDVEQICRELAAEHGIARRGDISDAEIVERCLYPLINEGARILEEGIAYRAGDIDVVWVLGYGFPAWRGGPIHMAEAIGASNIVRALQSYGSRFGNAHGYWTVAERLVQAAANGRPISDSIDPALPAGLPSGRRL